MLTRSRRRVGRVPSACHSQRQPRCLTVSNGHSRLCDLRQPNYRCTAARMVRNDDHWPAVHFTRCRPRRSARPRQPCPPLSLCRTLESTRHLGDAGRGGLNQARRMRLQPAGRWWRRPGLPTLRSAPSSGLASPGGRHSRTSLVDDPGARASYRVHRRPCPDVPNHRFLSGHPRTTTVGACTRANCRIGP